MVLQYKNGFMIKAPWCSSVEKHMLLAEEKKKTNLASTVLL